MCRAKGCTQEIDKHIINKCRNQTPGAGTLCSACFSKLFKGSVPCVHLKNGKTREWKPRGKWNRGTTRPETARAAIVENSGDTKGAPHETTNVVNMVKSEVARIIRENKAMEPTAKEKCEASLTSAFSRDEATREESARLAIIHHEPHEIENPDLQYIDTNPSQETNDHMRGNSTQGVEVRYFTNNPTITTSKIEPMVE